MFGHTWQRRRYGGLTGSILDEVRTIHFECFRATKFGINKTAERTAKKMPRTFSARKEMALDMVTLIMILKTQLMYRAGSVTLPS